MRITISGPPGSGKTTVGRLVAERLGYEFVSTGMVFRDMARERDMSLAEFGALALEDYDIDRELDRRIVALARERRDLVLEGRLAAHMLHLNGISAFKVWIDAHPLIRAERIAGREAKSSQQVMEEMREREECEKTRYRSIYGIDLDSLAVYDLVVHSDDIPPEKVADQIMEALEGYS